MRSRQTPRGSMAQSEASSDDEDALSPKPPTGEKGQEEMIQTELRGKGDTAEGSSDDGGQFNKPRIVKTGV